MKILISGATGFIGRKIVTELQQQNHQIRVLTRNPAKTATIFGDKVEAYAWNPGDEGSLDTALSGCDSLIHLAGEGIAEKRWSTKQKQLIYDSRVLGTRALVAALKRLGPNAPKTFVCASAIGIYGDRGDEVLAETAPPGNDFLAKVCADWEKEAAQCPVAIRRVSIRIGIVLGHEGGALKKLLPLFHFGLGGPVGSGKQWMSWIHVEDLARLIAEAVSNPAYQGAVNGVAPTPERNGEFGRIFGKILHRPAFLPTPGLALKIALGELSVLVLGSQRVVPQVAEKNGFKFNYPDLAFALGDIVEKKRKE